MVSARPGLEVGGGGVVGRSQALRREFVWRGLVPINEAAQQMGMGPRHLRALIKRHKVPVVLFPWQRSQVPGVPYRYVMQHRP